MMVESLELRRLLSVTPITDTDPGPEAGANFGNAIATNGTLALVAAPFREVEGDPTAGDVSLVDTTSGTVIHTFDNPAIGAFAGFGSGVAWVDGKILIGASGADAIFVYDGTTHDPLYTIANPNGGFAMGFGSSMAQINGDLLVGNGLGNDGPGEVLRFDLTLTGATHVATYSHDNSLNDQDVEPDPAKEDVKHLGSAIAVNEATGMIYAAATGAVTQRGIVVEFSALTDADTGTFQDTFIGPSIPSADAFGSALAVAGNNLLVGAANENAVYQINLTTEAYSPYIVPDQREQGLGLAIAVNGDQVALGSLDSAGGAVYIYTWADQTHVATAENPAEVDPNATNVADQFGASVAALPSGAFLVADPLDDFGTFVDENGSTFIEDSGAVYVYTPDAPEPEPTGPSIEVDDDGNLVVTGSEGDDTIVITKNGTTGGNVTMGELSESYTGERIIIRGGAGADKISVSPSANVAIEAYGGADNDSISGGSQADILIGGDGDDVLYGGAGRDLLIGGDGADGVYGEVNDDILIAPSTVHDDDTIKLNQIMTIWTSSADFADRVDQLRNGLLTAGEEVPTLNDGDADRLTGKNGDDWFVFDSSEDIATDIKWDELDFVMTE